MLPLIIKLVFFFFLNSVMYAGLFDLIDDGANKVPSVSMSTYSQGPFFHMMSLSPTDVTTEL
jgi:hypothetical protein